MPRRWRAAEVVIVPVPVQGDGAAELIAAGVQMLPDISGVDVAIVGRGGGSLEDLWAFNEEILARAIAASPIPIISAVSAPSSLAVAAAERFGQTLVGFLRDGRGNVYTNADRVAVTA